MTDFFVSLQPRSWEGGGSYGRRPRPERSQAIGVVSPGQVVSVYNRELGGRVARETWKAARQVLLDVIPSSAEAVRKR